MLVIVAQPCPTLCDRMDCSPSGPYVHGILQARILEWVAMPFSRRSSHPRDWTWVSYIADRFFTIWATKPVYPYGKKCKQDHSVRRKFNWEGNNMQEGTTLSLPEHMSMPVWIDGKDMAAPFRLSLGTSSPFWTPVYTKASRQLLFTMYPRPLSLAKFCRPEQWLTTKSSFTIIQEWNHMVHWQEHWIQKEFIEICMLQSQLSHIQQGHFRLMAI